jgi:hypothetical protein
MRRILWLFYKTENSCRHTAALFISSMFLMLPCPAISTDLVDLGRRIYDEGILPSGAPLQGKRFDSITLEGKEAACVSCHRRSGLGNYEGGINVPPVSGPFLFMTDKKEYLLRDPRSRLTISNQHEPYTDESLSKAMVTGVKYDGSIMSEAMPRYSLKNADMEALTAYLKQLSAQLSPGVGDSVINFATIITPDVDSRHRQALIDMMNAVIVQRNSAWQPGVRHMRTGPELVPRTERAWVLRIWELTGKPETWRQQLDQYYQREPVFAFLSGVSDSTWEPVHEFCQERHIPCLFPSVPVPGQKQDYFSFYFSRGVMLEADVMAKHLLADHTKKPPRVVQVFRKGDYVGASGAEALGGKLRAAGLTVETRVLQERQAGGLTGVLASLSGNVVVMSWLRPADMLVPHNKSFPATVRLYFSAILAEDEKTLFKSPWKSIARMVYPFEMPDKRVHLQDRRIATDQYLESWLKGRNIEIVDYHLQGEALFTMLFLTDLTAILLDNLYRDYIIERAEDMLSQELINSTAYPRLSLGVGQRFASKGAYIVRYDGDKLVSDTGWIVP